jgi:drug/metabolite transporter (DMT)-like permease
MHSMSVLVEDRDLCVCTASKDASSYVTMAVAGSPTLPWQKTNAVDVRVVISLAATYLIWGSTYLAMAIVVREIPPFLQGGMRFTFAGSVMFLIALKRGAKVPPLREWMRIAPVGALLFVGGNAFVAIGEKSVSSGGAAVVCATMPLWVAVLGSLGRDKPTPREWMSLVLGFSGVMVLMGGPSLAGEPQHVAILLCAPIAWAIGSVFQRRLPVTPTTKDPFMLPAVQMLCGGVLLGMLGLGTGETISADTSSGTWLGLLYLAVAGSLIGFTAYSWLLRNTRPVVATSYSYVNPIIAVLFGAAISGEPLGITTFVANGMIVIAVLLAVRRPTPVPEAERPST